LPLGYVDRADHSHLLTERAALPLAAINDEFRLLMQPAAQDPTPILWDDDGSRADLLVLGEHLLALYVQEAGVHRVLAVEVPFAVPLDESLRIEETLVGIVDLVEAAPDGSVYVTELKTSARRYDQARLRYDCQMSLYASAAATLGYPQPKLRYRVLLKTKQPALETYEVKRGTAQIAEAQRLVAQVTRAVDNGIFYPLRGWACAKCPFEYSCGE